MPKHIITPSANSKREIHFEPSTDWNLPTVPELQERLKNAHIAIFVQFVALASLTFALIWIAANAK